MEQKDLLATMAEHDIRIRAAQLGFISRFYQQLQAIDKSDAEFEEDKNTVKWQMQFENGFHVDRPAVLWIGANCIVIHVNESGSGEYRGTLCSFGIDWLAGHLGEIKIPAGSGAYGILPVLKNQDLAESADELKCITEESIAILRPVTRATIYALHTMVASSLGVSQDPA